MRPKHRTSGARGSCRPRRASRRRPSRGSWGKAGCELEQQTQARHEESTPSVRLLDACGSEPAATNTHLSTEETGTAVQGVTGARGDRTGPPLSRADKGPVSLDSEALGGKALQSGCGARSPPEARRPGPEQRNVLTVGTGRCEDPTVDRSVLLAQNNL